MSATAPTEAGHVWLCNACPFRTLDINAALAHAEETEGEYRRGERSWQHALYERPGGDAAKPAPRRIIADGGEARVGRPPRRRRARRG